MISTASASGVQIELTWAELKALDRALTTYTSRRLGIAKAQGYSPSLERAVTLALTARMQSVVRFYLPLAEKPEVPATWRQLKARNR